MKLNENEIKVNALMNVLGVTTRREAAKLLSRYASKLTIMDGRKTSQSVFAHDTAIKAA